MTSVPTKASIIQTLLPGATSDFYEYIFQSPLTEYFFL